MKNTMNEDEHAYLKQLQENRPKVYDEIKDLIKQTVRQNQLLR